MRPRVLNFYDDQIVELLTIHGGSLTLDGVMNSMKFPKNRRATILHYLRKCPYLTEPKKFKFQVRKRAQPLPSTERKMIRKQLLVDPLGLAEDVLQLAVDKKEPWVLPLSLKLLNIVAQRYAGATDEEIFSEIPKEIATAWKTAQKRFFEKFTKAKPAIVKQIVKETVTPLQALRKASDEALLQELWSRPELAKLLSQPQHSGSTLVTTPEWVPAKVVTTTTKETTLVDASAFNAVAQHHEERKPKVITVFGVRQEWLQRVRGNNEIYHLVKQKKLQLNIQPPGEHRLAVRPDWFYIGCLRGNNLLSSKEINALRGLPDGQVIEVDRLTELIDKLIAFGQE